MLRGFTPDAERIDSTYKHLKGNALLIPLERTTRIATDITLRNTDIPNHASSDQQLIPIHDLASYVLLPQLENLTYALEALLVTNPSPTAMKTLVEAREVMGNKMLPVRDAVMSSQGFAILYIQFIDEATNGDNLTPFVKEIQSFLVEDSITTIERAQRAVFVFREELESGVGRVTSSVGEDDDHLSLFIAESNQIISVMISTIEECIALFQESSECFGNIHKQSFDLESFKRYPPGGSFQLARSVSMAEVIVVLSYHQHGEYSPHRRREY